MEPKKKSGFDYVLYLIALVAVMYFALHGAATWKVTIEIFAAGKSEAINQLSVFTEKLGIRLMETPLLFEINGYTQQWCLWCGFAWLIVVASIENGKRNYIHGKEFGTARWGTVNDIKDLFAENIKNAEIKNLKKMKTWLGRWRVKKKKFAEVEYNIDRLYNRRFAELEAEKTEAKAAKTFDKEEHKQKLETLKKEKATELEAYKREAWKPYRFEAELKEKLKELEAQKNMISAEEYTFAVQDAKITYTRQLQKFLSNPARIKEIEDKYRWADMIFTMTERISFYNYKLNQNALIIGGSGSGKSRGYCLPNLLQANAEHGFSYIVTDPKGELLEKTGKFFTQMGYKIRVLNLDNKQESDCYNPFFYIHPFRMGYEERVLQLIETIIANTDGGKEANSSDPFWPKAERMFLQAIFFFVADAFPVAEQNMETALNLIAMLELAEEEDNKNSDLDLFVEAFEAWYKENLKHHYDDDAEKVPKHIGVRLYNEFRSKASGKTAKSIVISALARLTPFISPEITRITSHDSMMLDRVGEERTIVFVIVSPTDSTFNFVAGCLFTQLFQELQYCATQVHKHEGQRLPVPCRFILDEYANTCRIPNMLKILAYARSFGVGIAIILQSLEQAKEIHEKDWGVMVDNCNTLLYLGSVTHGDTLDYISKLLGKGTFDKRTTGRTRGKSGSSSQNFDVVGRELMDSAEIRKLPKNKCLLIVGGRNPFYSDKYEYTSHPNYCFTSDANRANSYEHHPLTEKQVLELEQARVQKIEEEQYKLMPAVEQQESKESTVKESPLAAFVDALSSIAIIEPSIELLKKVTSSLNDFDFIPDELARPDVECFTEVEVAELLGGRKEEFNALQDAFDAVTVEPSLEDKSDGYTGLNADSLVKLIDDPIEVALHLGRSFREAIAKGEGMPLAAIPTEIESPDTDEKEVDNYYLAKFEEEERLAEIEEELSDQDESSETIASILASLEVFANEAQAALPAVSDEEYFM